jgi:RNA polymerase sigma factor (sigma-70 family)
VSPHDLYAAHAELIESVLGASCRVHRLSPDDADEFCSWVRLRLLDQDRAILQKFAGRSSMRTFLVTVVERLFLDWRNHEWGKWRPSSEARRLGAIAIELERLVLRDRCGFEEAAQTLVVRGIADSVAACEDAWARLPRQPRRQRVQEGVLVTLPDPGGAADPVEEDENRTRARALVGALEHAVAMLPPADRNLLRLRYWSGVKVSRLAALVGEEQKALYRRFERLWTHLRQHLEAAGFSGADLDTLFARFDMHERDGAGRVP